MSDDSGDSDSFGNVSRNLRGCFGYAAVMAAMLLSLLLW
jgi:hypothetical protein